MLDMSGDFVFFLCTISADKMTITNSKIELNAIKSKHDLSSA